MNNVRVGVLGVGHLGKLHASIYSEVDNAELVGIYDTNLEKAKSLSEDLNVTAFNSREELLENVDAVNVVTPTINHFEAAQSALGHQCHVFIEKPLMATEEQATEIIKLAQDKNKVLQVGHIERFNPATMALSDVKLRPLFIESHRLASFDPRGTDVAVILDLMIHDLDLILALVKSEPVQIDASGVGVLSNTIDIANARIKFQSGCIANVTASRISTKKMRKMRIFQHNSYISLDFVEGFSEIYFLSQGEFKSFNDGTLAISLGKIDSNEGQKEIKYNKLQRKGINPLKYELTGFIESILTGVPPLVSGEDGLAALKLANQVLKKVEEHTKYVSERPLT
jgi:predicted dehydrogenase